MPAQRLALQAVTHQTKQSVESLAHVRSTHRQINPRRRSQSKHRLRLFQHGQQALQRRGIKPLGDFHSPPLAAGPLPTCRLSPFPLIPPPQACRCSPPLPRHALCALPPDGLRPLPVFCPPPLPPEIQRPHCYVMLLAKFSPPQPAGLKKRRPVAPPSARLRRC